MSLLLVDLKFGVCVTRGLVYISGFSWLKALSIISLLPLALARILEMLGVFGLVTIRFSFTVLALQGMTGWVLKREGLAAFW